MGCGIPKMTTHDEPEIIAEDEILQVPKSQLKKWYNRINGYFFGLDSIQLTDEQLLGLNDILMDIYDTCERRK